jgi:hypothetical protein
MYELPSDANFNNSLVVPISSNTSGIADANDRTRRCIEVGMRNAQLAANPVPSQMDVEEKNRSRAWIS